MFILLFSRIAIFFTCLFPSDFSSTLSLIGTPLKYYLLGIQLLKHLLFICIYVLFLLLCVSFVSFYFCSPYAAHRPFSEQSSRKPSGLYFLHVTISLLLFSTRSLVSSHSQYFGPFYPLFLHRTPISSFPCSISVFLFLFIAFPYHLNFPVGDLLSFMIRTF